MASCDAATILRVANKGLDSTAEFDVYRGAVTKKQPTQLPLCAARMIRIGSLPRRTSRPLQAPLDERRQWPEVYTLARRHRCLRRVHKVNTTNPQHQGAAVRPRIPLASALVQY
jgi:hypothetical protein